MFVTENVLINMFRMHFVNFTCTLAYTCHNIVERAIVPFSVVLNVFMMYFIAVIPEITAYLDEFSKRHESVIISQFKAIYRMFGKWIAYGVTLLHLGPGSSVAALFICKNQTSLNTLADLYDSGELHSMMEELFTSLLVTDDPQLKVRIEKLVWEPSDYTRCLRYFSTLPKRELCFTDLIV